MADINRTLTGCDAYFKHVHSSELEQIDRWMWKIRKSDLEEGAGQINALCHLYPGLKSQGVSRRLMRRRMKAMSAMAAKINPAARTNPMPRMRASAMSRRWMGERALNF